MKNYINTKPEFGCEGPYAANSKTELADEMKECFESWADDQWAKLDDFELINTNKKEFIHEAIAEMRTNFIDGLEEFSE